MLNNNSHMSLPAFINSYLNKFGEIRWFVELEKQKSFNNIVVIPAIQELNNIKQLLISLSANDKKYFKDTLLLFVVNNSEDSTKDVVEENELTLELLREIISPDKAGGKFVTEIKLSGLNIGLIDASTKGNKLLAKDAGVGLARKIGMDAALSLFDYQNNSKKILICLDADCKVDSNYLTVIVESFNQMILSAAIISYKHQIPDDENVKRAIICYEIFLRYYVLALQYAGSPFAYTSIGSTIACDVETYCKAGGMNKRKAGEDFYFLEKIAKFTRIYRINSTTVYPSSRESWRVPFGTGKSINRFLSDSKNEYFLYNPKIIVILKYWFEAFYSSDITNENELLSIAEKISPELQSFLEENSFREDWKRIINNSKSADQINKQKLMWFDGFRTMKLIHHLRDNGFPQVNMFYALDVLFSKVDGSIQIERESDIPTVDIQTEYLEVLRSLT